MCSVCQWHLSAVLMSDILYLRSSPGFTGSVWIGKMFHKNRLNVEILSWQQPTEEIAGSRAQKKTLPDCQEDLSAQIPDYRRQVWWKHVLTAEAKCFCLRCGNAVIYRLWVNVNPLRHSPVLFRADKMFWTAWEARKTAWCLTNVTLFCLANVWKRL